MNPDAYNQKIRLLKAESNSLNDKIDKLARRIEELYNEIETREVSIPRGAKSKIENYEEQIIIEAIKSLKSDILYKERIVKILEKLLKTPVLVLFYRGVTSGIKNGFLAVGAFFAAIGKGIAAFFLAILGFFAAIGAMFKSIGTGIKSFFLSLKPEPRPKKEKTSEPETAPEQIEQEEPAGSEIPKSSAAPVQSFGQVQSEEIQETPEEAEPKAEEKIEPVKEPVPPATPAAAYRTAPTYAQSPAETYKPEKKKEERKKTDEESNLLLYLAAMLILLFVGLLSYLITTNFSILEKKIKKEATPAIAEKTPEIKAPAISDCLPGYSGSEKTESVIEKINEKLKDTTYCCFENREIQIRDNIYNLWKNKNIDLIKCILKNLPDGYVLVMQGHANKTGFEEDIMLQEENGSGSRLVVGNFSYSSERVRAIFDEFKSNIEDATIINYGVGSNIPKSEPGIVPEDDRNRRITFHVMTREEALEEKNNWENRHKTIKKIK